MNKRQRREWEEKCKRCGLCCHDKELLAEGQDLAFVQQVLGHESPSMTKRYAQRTAKKIATVLSMRRGRVAVDKTVEIIK